MDLDTLRDSLIDVARELRPKGVTRVPLLALASECGLRAILRFHQDRKDRDARMELEGHPPRLVLYRRHAATGDRALTGADEFSLAPRERFSIAHELGHWVAWTRFGVRPAQEPSEYWAHEEVVNAFAGALLVPDWLAMEWLESRQEPSGVHPSEVSRWARLAGVSREVVATALANAEPNVGFLRLRAVTVPSGEGAWGLQVAFRAAGAGLSLPNLHVRLRGSDLVGLLAHHERGGSEVAGASIGSLRHPTVFVRWERLHAAPKPADASASHPLIGAAWWASISPARHTRQLRLLY